MATISVTTFKFNYPDKISGMDYQNLKKMLSDNPRKKLSKYIPSASFKDVLWELVFTIILAIIGASIAYFGFHKVEIAIIILMLGIGIKGFITLISLVSYFAYISEKIGYWNSLEKCIMSSNNYEHFIEIASKSRIIPYI